MADNQGGKHVPHIGDDFAADLHIGIVEDEKRVVSRCAVKSGKFGGDRVGLRIDVFKIDEDQLARGYLGGGNALLYVHLCRGEIHLFGRDSGGILSEYSQNPGFGIDGIAGCGYQKEFFHDPFPFP